MSEPLTHDPPRPTAPLGLLLCQSDAWRYCGLSRAGWYRLRSADRLPAPVSIPGVGLRWRRADLDAWATKLKPTRERRPPVAAAAK